MEEVDGLAQLRVKFNHVWHPLSNFTEKCQHHPGNWFRSPPMELGNLVWRGAIPNNWRDQVASQRSHLSSPKLGRTLLRLLHSVWKSYAAKLAPWKAENGLQVGSPHVPRNRTRVPSGRVSSCLGALCTEARLEGHAGNTVKDHARIRCAACLRLDETTANFGIHAMVGVDRIVQWATRKAKVDIRYFPQFRATMRGVFGPKRTPIVKAAWRAYVKDRRGLVVSLKRASNNRNGERRRRPKKRRPPGLLKLPFQRASADVIKARPPAFDIDHAFKGVV
jgi:hypothetical protein